jgi:trehalose 6-phosphate synthase
MLVRLKQAWSSREFKTFAIYGVLAFLFVLIVVFAVSPAAVSLMRQWSRGDVEMRSKLIFSLTEDNLGPLLAEQRTQEISALFERIAGDEKVLAVGFCDRRGALRYATQQMPKAISCVEAARSEAESYSLIRANGREFLVAAFPVAAAQGHFVILNDLAFANQRGAMVRRYFIAILSFLVFGVAIAATTVVFVYIRGWIARLRRTLLGARSGDGGAPEAGPFEQEVRLLLRQLEFGRRGMEEDATAWDAAALRRLMNSELSGTEVLVVSNREPYIHNHAKNGTEVQLPASGLVTALEPVMRACGGTWIAHGSGSADRDVVDERDRIAVPPGHPAYALRRIWLTDDEQDKYYYGLANEGLWPLCHIAFERPVFRETDWQTYKAVNERFAEAVVKEAKSPDPIVLVQDYHFALLPRMVRDRLPGATIITFWHIPWPNSETFGICPWKEEIVEGLLGSTILGFHTQFHCNNFLETVDRFVESRIDREHASVTLGGHEAFVRPYPISIAWPPAALEGLPAAAECRRGVFERLGLPPEVRLAVGVERFDYTKGILDRMRAVDSFLQAHPEWRGRFAFYQAAAPTRSKLSSYRQVQEQAEELAREINARHAGHGCPAIMLSIRHHEPAEVFELFRAADLCIVSSLHDGMNLVAKEFVAAREDELGVLILSSFAGASRELSEALIVNPYDANGMGATIAQALAMPEAEQRERMHLMRDLVKSRNVYRWAGQMLLDASRLRKKQRILELALMGQERPAPQFAGQGK